MNAINFFYQNQAKARGLDTLADVEAMAPMINRVYDALVLLELPANKSADIYELACGPGLVLSWLKRRGYNRATGTDFSAPYVALATQAGLSAELKDSIIDLKAKANESQDVLIAIDFMEHLPKDIFVEFLAESLRVLRPGGVLILRGPNADSPLCGRNLYNDITHCWAYTTISLAAMAKVFNFSQLVVKDDCASPAPGKWQLLFPLTWLARKLLNILWALATRERILYWGPSYFAFFRK
jgi:SAM-dependent methyltransferase